MIEIPPTRGLLAVLKGKFIAAEVGLQVSTVEMVIRENHLLATAG
ncbi:MAG: hypothetical protein ACXU9W_15380 [Thermodesulfobacteriota bacterium]